MDGWTDECGAGIAAHPHDLACALRRGHDGPHADEGRRWTDEEASALDGRLRRALEDARATARAVVLGTMTPRDAACRRVPPGRRRRRESPRAAAARQPREAPMSTPSPRTLWVSDDALGTPGAEACRRFLRYGEARLSHFARRAIERGDPPELVAIAVLEVDDALGRAVADLLMPGFDWQAIRDRGEVPVGYGLAGREGLQNLVDAYDPRLGVAVREVPAGCLPVVIVAGGTIAVSAEVLPVLCDPPRGGN